MNDMKTDKLAERVRLRREAEGIAPATADIRPPQSDINNESNVSDVEAGEGRGLADLSRELQGQDDDVLASAARIAAARARGVSTEDMAAALGVSKSWVSKRVALLDATPEVAEKIRTGVMTATDFYNRARASKNTGHRRYVRQPAVSIHADTAQALLEILASLATAHGVAGIRLDRPLNKRELATALNLRAAEIRALL
jgi:hypothetical protein